MDQHPPLLLPSEASSWSRRKPRQELSVQFVDAVDVSLPKPQKVVSATTTRASEGARERWDRRREAAAPELAADGKDWLWVTVRSAGLI